MKNFIDLIFFFAIYSFLGWILETVFASANERKFINRGFLTGFFCPIYGFGAILIVRVSAFISIYIKSYYKSTLTNVIISIILVTALEYITGFILEKFFNCKWWDYSDNYANINGYICLKYSFLWGIIAIMMLQIVHPIILKTNFNISFQEKVYFVMIFLIYFISDIIKSVIDALNLRKLILNYSKYTVNKYYEKIIKYKRIFAAYPHLMIVNARVINRDIRSILNEKIYKIKVEFKNKFQW